MSDYIGTRKQVDEYIGSRLVEAAYLGSRKYYDAYSEVSGSLPLVYESRVEHILKNYALYGSASGAGVETENLCDCTTFAAGHLDPNGNVTKASDTTYVNGLSDGSIEFTTNTAWRGVHTEKILLPTGATKIRFAYSGTSANNRYRFAFYDSNGDFVSASAQSGANSFTVTIPSGAASVAIGIQLSTVTTYKFTRLQLYTDLDTITAFVPYGYQIPLANTGKNLWDGTFAYVGKIIATDDLTILVDNSNYSTSPFIDVDAGDYVFKLNNPYQQGNTTTRMACYRDDGTGIGLLIEDTSPRPYDCEYNITVPAEAKKIRFSVRNTDTNVQLSKASTYPLYIGDSKLGEEEYLDYESWKVYKRTAQLFNKDATDTNNGYVEGRYLVENGSSWEGPPWDISEYIEVEPNATYTITPRNLSSSPSIVEYDASKNYIAGHRYGRNEAVTITTDATTRYVRASVPKNNISTVLFVKGSTLPETYIPYYQPTDPPVPFPAITAYKGENTLSSTETVGPVTVKGRINEPPT